MDIIVNRLSQNDSSGQRKVALEFFNQPLDIFLKYINFINSDPIWHLHLGQSCFQNEMQCNKLPLVAASEKILTYLQHVPVKKKFFLYRQLAPYLRLPLKKDY